MSDPKYKFAAEVITQAQPVIAGKSAFPPQSWRIEGEELVVLGADGRKFRGPLVEMKRAASQFVKAEKLMQLPIKSPAKNKAGKQSKP